MTGPVTDWLNQYQPATVAAYQRVLAEFAASCGRPPERAAQDDVLAYQAAISEQAAASCALKMNALASFFKYLTTRGIRSDNPMAAIRRERYRVDPLRSVKYLTKEEVAALLAASDSDRTSAVLAVLLHGLRLAELVSLNVEQYREGAILAIEGKGGRIRGVPLNPAALPILDRYIRRRRSGPLFLSRTGRRIGRRAVQELVYRVSARAGKRVSAHQLRHTAATILLRNHAGLETVQDLLGHRSPATTRIYARLELSDLADAVTAAPLLGGEPLRLVQDEMPEDVAVTARLRDGAG
jgi:site-specific recombinase XerD